MQQALGRRHCLAKNIPKELAFARAHVYDRPVRVSGCPDRAAGSGNEGQGRLPPREGARRRRPVGAPHALDTSRLDRPTRAWTRARVYVELGRVRVHLDRPLEEPDGHEIR